MGSADHYQRTHHIVLFVLQNVAVPDILVPVPIPLPAAMLGLTVKGTLGRSNFMITVVTSPGFIRTVSFQPSSLGSGGVGDPKVNS